MGHAGAPVAHAFVIAGGSGLLLLGLTTRVTRDLDALALVEQGEYRTAQPLPAPLTEAIVDVGELFGLAPEWLNPGPTDLIQQGLPSGFEQRATTLSYGSLTLHVASRFDQICFKLYALADQGPRSKHAADLRALNPTREESIAAARWAQTHDPSLAFRQVLIEALAFLGVPDASADL